MADEPSNQAHNPAKNEAQTSAGSGFNYLTGCHIQERLGTQGFPFTDLILAFGYGPVIGKLFLILTQIGRKSGKVRRTALEYHRLDGQIYVFSAWAESDWFNNIQSEPRVTVQTDEGTMPALARVLNTNAEYYEAHRLVEQNMLVRGLLEGLGMDVSLTGFMANKDRLRIVTFDPIDQPTPPPLEADLKWVSPLVIAAFALGYLLGKTEK